MSPRGESQEIQVLIKGYVYRERPVPARVVAALVRAGLPPENARRVAARLEVDGVATVDVTPDDDPIGPALAAAGVAYERVCWHRGPCQLSTVKLAFSADVPPGWACCEDEHGRVVICPAEHAGEAWTDIPLAVLVDEHGCDPLVIVDPPRLDPAAQREQTAQARRILSSVRWR